jgi:hypothetical protein
MAYNPRRQGDLGEASAIEWLTLAGARVAKPLFNDPDYDLIADWGDRLERVQVKTSIRLVRNGRYHVQLCTRGGNQSWSGISKRLDASRCDTLFVHLGDGRRWYIPAADLGGCSAIMVGGPKYAQYEVESGRPLPPRPTISVAPTLNWPAPAG